mgnify:CR=1 FL=1
MKKPDVVEALLKLLYWYDSRSETFRERANLKLWNEAREVLRAELKRKARV